MANPREFYTFEIRIVLLDSTAAVPIWSYYSYMVEENVFYGCGCGGATTATW
jgi:hypothetical protein